MPTVGFQSALSALMAAQRALQVVGHNIANAGTPGYTRQRVSLSSLGPTSNQQGLWIGRGVGISSVDRIADALLEGRIRTQSGEVGKHLVRAEHLIQLEAIFGEPSANGLGGTLGGLFSRLSQLTGTPEDPGLRSSVVQSGLTVAETFNTVRRQLLDVSNSLDDAVSSELAQINKITAEIHDLNDRIVGMRIGPEVPSDLLDQQQQLLKELSQHLNISVQFDHTGRASVVSSGAMLVSPRGSLELKADGGQTVGAPPTVRAAGATRDFVPRAGRLRGLLDLASGSVETRVAKLDQLARNLILGFNRVHSTGVPAGGGYTELVSSNTFTDANNSGTPLDDRLYLSGLPFDIQQGSLYVNMTDELSGNVTRTRIDIDPGTMTVQGLRDALNAIPNLSATVDPTGHLRLYSQAGYRFDFSNKLPPAVDLGNTFGAAQASIVGTAAERFSLGAGQNFTLSVGGGPAQTVTFNTAQFGSIAAATASEVAAAINAQVTGATAEAVDGRVVIRANAGATPNTLQLTDGTGGPLGTLGLSTALETGGSSNVSVELSGQYVGTMTQDLTFVPTGDGTIGVTPGLQVDVFDRQGNKVATLDVGGGYTPKTPITLMDGVSITFGPGEISRTSGDRFQTTLVADSDTSDVLVAMGLGGFFTGHDANTIGVSKPLVANADLLAAALSGASADNANLLKLLEVQDQDQDELDGTSINRFYDMLVSELSTESARSTGSLETQGLVLSALESRRDQISGVNLDEELLLMEQFQQAFQVAARFLQTMQEVNDILANLTN